MKTSALVVRPGPRALCDRCRRPTTVCVCAHLPTLSPRTRVLIVQHPLESHVAIGTARMASRCLLGSSVVVGTSVEAHPEVARALADPTRTPVLLWPGADAQDLANSPPSGPVTLVVVDGTWWSAKKLLTLNPSIARLPRYSIAPEGPSEYRIRREPRAECLSTIEAIANALGVLEGDPEPYRAMLEPFRAMVDTQIRFMDAGHHPRDRSRLLRRGRPVWTPPPPLLDPSRLLIVAAESNAWPFEAKGLCPDEMVHWVAIRGDESERCDWVARPTQPLAPNVTRHTELEPEVLLGGSSRAEFLAAIGAFLKKGDAVATWGTYATRLMADANVAAGGATIDLRRVAADWCRRSPGSIEQFIEGLGITPPVLGRGRGGRRLGLMWSVFQAVVGPRRA